MLSVLRNLSIGSKLFLLVGTFVVSLVGFGYFSGSILSEAKVNGPLYKKIVRDKDLIADILPPPVYILESYLVAYRMRETTDKDARDLLIQQFKKLKADYYTRLEYWSENLEKGELKDELFVRSRPPADAFLSAMEGQFIPALAESNESATKILEGVLTTKYNDHRVDRQAFKPC